jgi:hypothetical protein
MWLFCEVLLFCYSGMSMEFEFSPQTVEKITQISKVVKLHSVGAEVGRADRQTDGRKWRS